MGKENMNKILFSSVTLVFYFSWLLLTQIIFSNVSVMTTVIGFFVAILFLFLFVFLYNKQLRGDFTKFKQTKPIYDIIFYLLLTCFSFLVGLVILTVCQIPYTDTLLEQFRLMPIYTCFSVLLFAPIVEAIVFGAVFKNVINQKWLYVLVSAFTYGILNAVFMPSLTSALIVIPFLLAGFSLALMYVKTNNLILYTAVNCLFNVGILLVLLT